MQCLAVTIPCLLLISPGAQESESLDDRYVVRQVDEDVLLLDLKTGWTWKRVGTNKDKAPRWRQVPRFRNVAELTTWLDNNPIADEIERTDDVRWATEVLFGLEAQARASQPTTIRRWVSSPTVSVMSGTAEQEGLVNKAIQQINNALKPATRLKLKPVKIDDKSAAIKVYFMPFAEFPAFCRENNLVYSAIDDGCFYTRWDRGFRITEAQVLIASDRSSGDVLKHLILEELTQSLGPMNDSAFKRDSVFFSGRSAGTQLSDDDKRLMQVLYSKLKPGDTRNKANAAIARALQQGKNPRP